MAEVFRVEAIPAGPGDALVVEWGSGREKHRMLVDAGPKARWPGVRARLAARRSDTYAAFVVTHIDEDHIGGAVELLDDATLRSRVRVVWFNGYVHCAKGGSVLGPVNGEQFTSRLLGGPYAWNEGWPRPVAPGLGGPLVVPSKGDLPTMDLPGGARAVLLAPNGPQLKRVAREWDKVVTKAGLVPGAGDQREGRAVGQAVLDFPPLPEPLDRPALTELAARVQDDTSAANGSSIAFVLEYDGKRLLLPGDAHAGVLTANLARYAAMVGEERPRLDLVKLPHHGSGANLTAALADAWDAHRFLISTDGTGYLHPDDSAIARVLLAARRPPVFYANHASGGPARWAARAAEADATFTLARDDRSGITVVV